MNLHGRVVYRGGGEVWVKVDAPREDLPEVDEVVTISWPKSFPPDLSQTVAVFHALMREEAEE